LFVKLSAKKLSDVVHIKRESLILYLLTLPISSITVIVWVKLLNDCFIMEVTVPDDFAKMASSPLMYGAA